MASQEHPATCLQPISQEVFIRDNMFAFKALTARSSLTNYSSKATELHTGFISLKNTSHVDVVTPSTALVSFHTCYDLLFHISKATGFDHHKWPEP